jgi:NADH:ubiquinone oxidoreductase subunit 6 (subunit J)
MGLLSALGDLVGLMNEFLNDALFAMICFPLGRAEVVFCRHPLRNWPLLDVQGPPIFSLWKGAMTADALAWILVALATLGGLVVVFSASLMRALLGLLVCAGSVAAILSAISLPPLAALVLWLSASGTLLLFAAATLMLGEVREALSLRHLGFTRLMGLGITVAVAVAMGGLFSDVNVLPDAPFSPMPTDGFADVILSADGLAFATAFVALFVAVVATLLTIRRTPH